MTLPEIAIRRPVTVLMALVSLVVLGLVALGRLPLGFLPDMEQPSLFVNVPYPNATPEQVERMVVRPLEEALGSVKGLRGMWSHCSGDGGTISLRFEWGHPMDLARAEVRVKLDRVRRDLPEDVEEVRISSNWDAREADEPILEGRLSSVRDLSESYDLLDRKIVKPLERIPGVAQVRLDGVRPKEVRTLGSFESLDQIRSLVVRADGLRLTDVADVVYEEPPLEYGRHLDGRFAVGATVTKEAGGNAVEICDAVERRVAAMNADPELEGVDFLIWFDQGAEIKQALRNLTSTGIFGALLAAAVLFVFLRRVSMTVASVACIPFSLIVLAG